MAASVARLYKNLTKCERFYVERRSMWNVRSPFPFCEGREVFFAVSAVFLLSGCLTSKFASTNSAIDTPLSGLQVSVDQLTPTGRTNQSALVFSGEVGTGATTVVIYASTDESAGCVSQLGSASAGVFEATGIAANLSSATDGPYFFWAQASNLSTQGDCTPVNFSFVYDSTPPVISNLSIAATSTSLTESPSATWDAVVDPNSGVVAKLEYSIGNGTDPNEVSPPVAWTAFSSVTQTSLQVSGLALTDSTTYYFKLRATDSAGNVAVENAPWYVSTSGTIDLSVSNMSLTPQGRSNSSNLTFTGTAGTSATTVNIYGSTNSTLGCTTLLGSSSGSTFPTTGVSVTLASPVEGPYFFWAQGTNGTSTGTCTGISAAFVYDITPPTITGLTATPTVSNLSTQSPLISWNAIVDPNGGSIASVQYTITSTTSGDDPVPTFVDMPDPTQTSITVNGLTLTDTHVYDFTLQATDAAGNVSQSVVSWTYDSLSPGTLSAVYPSDNVLSSQKRNYSGTCTTGGNVVATPAWSTALAPVSCVNGAYSVQIDFSTFLAEAPDPIGAYAGQASVQFAEAAHGSIAAATSTKTISYQPPLHLGSGFNGNVLAIAYATDVPNLGKVYVGGAFTTYQGVTVGHLVRLNYDGSLDLTFSTNMGTGFNGSVLAILPLSAGQVVVGGSFSTFGSTPAVGIAELQSTGVFDGSFSIGSGFKTESNANAQVDALALALDNGDILVGGNFTRYNSTTDNYKFFARLTTGGVASSTLPTSLLLNNSVLAIASTSAGDVYLGGAFTTYGITTVNHIAHISSAGVLDTNFIQGTTNKNFDQNVYALLYDSSASLLYIGGAFTKYGDDSSWKGLLRVSTSGARDVSFKSPQFLNGTSSGIVYALQKAGDGSLIVGGNFNNNSLNKIAKLSMSATTGGTVDSTFLAGSGAGFSATITTYIVYALAASSDYANNFAVGGSFQTYRNQQMPYYARLRLDGNPDSGTYNQGGPNNTVRVVQSLNDNTGRVYVGGDFTTWDGVANPYLVRLLADGSLDTSFVSAFTTASGDGVYAIALDSSGIAGTAGEIFVGGLFSKYNATTTGALVKLTSAGLLDSHFNSTIGTGVTGGTVMALLQDPSTFALYIGGSFTALDGAAQAHLTALTSAAGVLANFHTNANPSANVYALAMATPGSDLYVGGAFTTIGGGASNRLAALYTTGSNIGLLDATTFVVGATGFNNDVHAILLDTGGNVFVGGNFTTYKGTTEPARLVRLLAASGSIDPNFNPSGGAGFDGIVYDMILDESGDLIVVGAFSNYSGTLVNGVARLSDTGGLDTSFISGTRAYTNATDPLGVNFYGTTSTHIIYSISNPNDGSERLWLGGSFTVYSGANRADLIRLMDDSGSFLNSTPEDGRLD